ncbi:Putative adhesin [Bacillus cereus]|nr:Putative adhesin [Bacillus cereus]
MVKKIIVIAILFITIASVVFGFKVFRGKDFKKEKSFEINHIKEIEVDNENWDIEFKSTDANKIVISAQGKRVDKEIDPIEIEQAGNKVIVKQKQKATRFFNGFTFRKKNSICIAIPKKEIDKIVLNNKSGDVKISDIEVKNIVTESESGDEMVVGLSAEKGEFISQSGELAVKDSSVQELNIKSTTGDNYIASVSNSNMNITSTSGEVLLKDMTEGKSLFIETKSGDIGVRYKGVPTSLKLMAKSNSSDVMVNVKGLKKDKNTEKVKAGTIGDAKNEVKILSKTGAIYID